MSTTKKSGEDYLTARYNEAVIQAGQRGPLHDMDGITVWMHGAEWGRCYEAEREATDAEVLDALNAHLLVTSPRSHPAPELNDYYAPESIEAMRAALTAFRLAGMEE